MGRASHFELQILTQTTENSFECGIALKKGPFHSIDWSLVIIPSYKQKKKKSGNKSLASEILPIFIHLFYSFIFPTRGLLAITSQSFISLWWHLPKGLRRKEHRKREAFHCTAINSVNWLRLTPRIYRPGRDCVDLW